MHSKDTLENSTTLLKNSLLALMKNKKLDQIRVGEIAANAGLSRATFYLYYDNTSMIYDELLMEYLAPLEQICAEKTDRCCEKELEYKLRRLIDFIDSHYDAFAILFSDKDNPYFSWRITNIFSDLLLHTLGDIEQDYLFSLVAAALTNIIRTWLERGLSFSSPQMDNIIKGNASNIYSIYLALQTK